jgi:squalene-hopene/tetraprenyl-beta-curcumene cyclase
VKTSSKRKSSWKCGTIAITALLTGLLCQANEQVAISQNSPDEPITASYSAEKSIDFIERSVTRWQNRRKCVTCHTNGLHLMAGSQVTPRSRILSENRKFARKYLMGYVTGETKPHGGHGAIEGLVASSSFLAIGEMISGETLHPDTAKGLDYIWTQLNESGAWKDWLKCHWGPFEVDDHFGVTLASLAISMSPQSYKSKPNVVDAYRKMKRFLETNKVSSLHQKGMLIWISKHDPTLVSEAEKNAWVAEIKSLQQMDGGWVLIHLGNEQWKREDSQPQSQKSDGYATAFALYTLRQAETPADDEIIRRGVSWLKTRQRSSGRWFTHSPRRDGKHYITQAGTSMALMALASCGDLD